MPETQFKINIGSLSVTPHVLIKRLFKAVGEPAFDDRYQKFREEINFFEKRFFEARCLRCAKKYLEHSTTDQCPNLTGSKFIRGRFSDNYFIGGDDFFKIVKEIKHFIYILRIQGIITPTRIKDYVN